VTIAFATSTSKLTADVSAGLYWVAMLFASVLALPRTVLVEEEQGTGDLLRLLARPHAVYWGKALFNLMLIEVVGVVLGFCYVILVGLDVTDPLLFLASVFGGCAALAGAVTLSGAIVARAASRYALAAAVSMPLLLSILVLGVSSMRSAFGVGSHGWALAFGGFCYAVAEFAIGPWLFAAVWKS
jgi:heme exporter protein B